MAHLRLGERLRGSAVRLVFGQTRESFFFLRDFGLLAGSFLLTIRVWGWGGDQDCLAVVLQEFDVAHALLGASIFGVVLRGRVFNVHRVGRLVIVGVVHGGGGGGRGDKSRLGARTGNFSRLKRAGKGWLVKVKEN